MRLNNSIEVFCKEGDSGSWVISGNDLWLGMLVAGNERHQLSYIVLAEPLVEYLGDLYNKNSGNIYRERSAHIEDSHNA